MPGQDASGPKVSAYIRDEYGAFRQPKFECGCCEMLILGFVVYDRTNMCCLYRNSDQDDRIFYCLLT